MTAYVAILTTALAAFLGTPIWAVIPGAAVLFAVAVYEQRKISARFAAFGSSHVIAMAQWQSAGHALMASGAAYGLGLLLHFLALQPY